MSRRPASTTRTRPAAAALEFCFVASLLLMIFLAMIELGRAMMVLGGIANAARAGARAGALTAGDYSACVSAAQTALAQGGIPGTPEVVVSVDGVEVSDDAAFRSAAVPGASISVCVKVPYANVSWLPAGTGMFLSPQQTLAETA